MEASQPVENAEPFCATDVCSSRCGVRCGITCSDNTHLLVIFLLIVSPMAVVAMHVGSEMTRHGSMSQTQPRYPERAQDEPQELVTGAFVLVLPPGEERGLVVSRLAEVSEVLMLHHSVFNAPTERLRFDVGILSR